MSVTMPLRIVVAGPRAVPFEQILVDRLLIEAFVEKDQLGHVVRVGKTKCDALIKVVEGDRFVHRQATRRE